MESNMYFKYDNISDFLIKLSSNIEIVSCICYGIDTNVGSQVSDIIPYLEHHAIRDAITEKMEEELSKKINKHHTTLLHDSSSYLTSWLNYVRPSHDFAIINTIGPAENRYGLVRDIVIYSIKQKTKFILLDHQNWPTSDVPMFDNSGYSLISVQIEDRPYYLFYTDIVYNLLNNTSDNN
jgi:hypothetical protein